MSGQRESLRLTENVSSRVDNLTGSNFCPCSFNRGVNSREGSYEENAQEMEDSRDVTQKIIQDNKTCEVL